MEPKKSVEITEMIVPKLVKVGEDVELTCNYKVRGSNLKLYTVNWWRGNTQFFTYKDYKTPPMSAFPFDGIEVDVSKGLYTRGVFRRAFRYTIDMLWMCTDMNAAAILSRAKQTRVWSFFCSNARLTVAKFGDIPLRPGVLLSVDLWDITQNRLLTSTDL